jgi:hypothetical protein
VVLGLPVGFVFEVIESPVASVRLLIFACKCSSRSLVDTKDFVTLSFSIDTTLIKNNAG